MSKKNESELEKLDNKFYLKLHAVKSADWETKYNGKLFEAADFAELLDSSFYIDLTMNTQETSDEFEHLLNEVPKQIARLIHEASKEFPNLPARLPEGLFSLEEQMIPETNLKKWREYAHLLESILNDYWTAYQKWFKGVGK